MPKFDYTQAAELFSANRRGSKRAQMGYHRFQSAALAIQYAIEVLPEGQLAGAVLQIGEERYDAALIRNLYEDANYPMKRAGQR